MAYLAHNGFGASVEGLDIFGGAILSPQALRGELYRRQGILDLVSDPPGDIPPCGVALGGHQPGDIVESQNHALRAATGAGPKTASFAIARNIQFLLRLTAPAIAFRSCARGDRSQFGRDLLQTPSEARSRLQAKENIRLMVGGGHAPLGIKADYPGAHPGQHGLREQATSLRLLGGGSESLLLAAQVSGHAVEGSGKDGDLLRIASEFHARGEISLRYSSSGLHQLGYRLGEARGRRHAQPDGAHQHKQDSLEVAQGERGLDPQPALLRVTVVRERGFSLPEMVEDAVVERADHVKVGVRVGAQTIQSAKEIRGLEGADRHIPFVGRLKGRGGRNEERGTSRPVSPRKHSTVAVYEIGGGKAVIGGEPLQIATEGDGRVAEAGSRRIERLGHGRHVVANEAGLLLDVRARDCR